VPELDPGSAQPDGGLGGCFVLRGVKSRIYLQNLSS
jgi:hypothetical protein